MGLPSPAQSLAVDQTLGNPNSIHLFYSELRPVFLTGRVFTGIILSPFFTPDLTSFGETGRVMITIVDPLDSTADWDAAIFASFWWGGISGEFETVSGGYFAS